MHPALADLVSDALGEATAALDDCELVLARAERHLDEATDARTDGDLLALAAHQEVGDIPLLGTAHRTQPYPALLWNGERFERLNVPWPARLVFLAEAVAGSAAERQRLARSVQVGEAVRRRWPPPARTSIAALTTGTVGTATCAGVAGGEDERELGALAELAAALMLVTPAEPGPEVRGLGAGHVLATGWLALQLFRSGVTATPGTAAEVLATRGAS